MLLFPSKDEIIQLAREAAVRYALDPDLVVAIVEQESNYDPWAVRVEPRFYEKYTQPMAFSDTEEYTRAISWGVMQVMGESARELNFKGWLTRLLDPETCIDVGCQWFRVKLAKAGGDVRRALLLWNGGGNQKYADEVLVRMDRIKTQ